MAEETEKAVPWYQEKKWVVSAGLICGLGLGALLLEPVVDDIVPILFSESASEPASAESEPGDAGENGDAGGAEAGDTSETTSADGDDTSEDSPDTTGEDDSGNAGESQSEGPYELVILGTEDVSVDETIYKVVTAELNLYPADKDKLRDALDKELDQFRGEAHAVSVKVFFDRREGGSPAFGAWNWAPEGDWSKAEEGDPQSWNDYEWNEPDIDKFESPESCAPPGEEELSLSGAYYKMAEVIDTVADSEAAPEEDPVEDPQDPQDPLEDASKIEDPAEDASQVEDPAGDASQVQDPQEEATVLNTGAPDPGAMDAIAEEAGTTVEMLSEALANTSEWVAC